MFAGLNPGPSGFQLQALAIEAKLEGFFAPNVASLVRNQQRLGLIAARVAVEIPFEGGVAEGHGPPVGDATTPEALSFQQGNHLCICHAPDAMQTQQPNNHQPTIGFHHGNRTFHQFALSHRMQASG